MRNTSESVMLQGGEPAEGAAGDEEDDEDDDDEDDDGEVAVEEYEDEEEDDDEDGDEVSFAHHALSSMHITGVPCAARCIVTLKCTTWPGSCVGCALPCSSVLGEPQLWLLC